MNTKVFSIISVYTVLNVNTDVMLENANTRKIYAVSDLASALGMLHSAFELLLLDHQKILLERILFRLEAHKR